MARYIDANKLQEDFEKIADEPDYMHEGETWQTGIYLAGTITDMQPTADVVEVKRGHWIEDEVCVYTCSECGFTFTSADNISEFKFCRCGAKMDGTPKERGEDR